MSDTAAAAGAPPPASAEATPGSSTPATSRDLSRRGSGRGPVNLSRRTLMKSALAASAAGGALLLGRYDSARPGSSPFVAEMRSLARQFQFEAMGLLLNRVAHES